MHVVTAWTRPQWVVIALLQCQWHSLRDYVPLKAALSLPQRKLTWSGRVAVDNPFGVLDHGEDLQT